MKIKLLTRGQRVDLRNRFLLFLMMVAAIGGWGQTVFTETMGTGTGTSTIAATVFDNSATLGYNGTGDTRTTSASSTYTGASGGKNVFITSTTGTYFTIYNINSSAYTNLQLTFGLAKSTAAGTALTSTQFVVEVATDYVPGTNTGTFTALTFANVSTAANAWSLISPTGTIPSSTTLAIRFRQASTTHQVRIDDVKLTGDSSSSNTITTSTTIAGSPFCVTSTTGSAVSVGFTSVGTFTAGNVYTAQLSNASGSFTAPVAIGTLTSVANSGTISATIPANTATGTGYRIRVVSSTPSTTGSNNGSNLVVNLARNSIAATTDQNILTNANGTALTVAEQSTASSREWKYTTTSGSGYVSFGTLQTGTSYTPNFSAPGTYYVVCQSTFACGTATSNEVKITVVSPPANDLCASSANVVVNAAAINGSLLGASKTAPFTSAATVNDVWYKFTAVFPASYTVSVGGFSGDVDVELYNTECPASTTSYIARGISSSTPEIMTATLTPGTYYIRVYSVNSAASTSNFTISVVSPPSLSTSVSTLDFGDVVKGTSSVGQSFDLSGYFLTGSPAKIIVDTPTDYEVSLDNTNWSDTLEIEDTDANTAINTTIYVRFNTAAICGVSSGEKITFSGGGVSSLPTIALAANSYVPSVIAKAATSVTNRTFISNWKTEESATQYTLDVYTKTGGVSQAVNETFTWASNGTGGNSGGWSGNVASATISASDLSGWTIASGYKGDGSAKVGTSSARGSLTTPALGFAGNGTLTFRAGAWAGDSTNLVLEITGGGTLSVTSVTMLNSAFSSYTVDITGATAATRIAFRGNAASSSRFFLDDVNVVIDSVVKTPVAGSPFTITAPTTSQTITGLSPNTNYYYNVNVLNGSCVSEDSNEVSVITKNAVVWDGVAWSNVTGPTSLLDAEITGYYNLTTSFEVNNLSIADTGSLTIQADTDVIVHGEVIIPADNKITLESDANLVQTTVGEDGNTANYSIIVKRNSSLPTKGYTFWSSPVSGQNLYNFSNGYNQASTTDTGTPWNRFYVYNEATDYFVTKIAGEIELNSTSVFDAGRGYAIKGMNSFGNDFPYTGNEFSFTGKMNNGTLYSQKLNNSCTVEEGCEKGYNLVGNPYPSSIDFEALYAANSSKIYGTAYFWTNNDITVTQQAGTGYSGNNYAIYNLSGGTPAVDPDPNQGNGFEVPNGIIKLGQGFIVKSKVAGKGQSLEFNNDIRLGYDSGAVFYNNRKAEKNRFWLTLTSPANVANSILVAYIPEATNDFEVNYDGELFVIGSDSFYSILGSKKLAIQGKADFNADDKVALGNVYSKNGEYKISIKDKEGIFKSGQSIYLKDKVLNKVVNLSQGDYVFQGVKGTDATRFEIVYKEDAVLAADNASKSGFSVYKDGNSYVITSSKKLGKVEVYDTAGRLMTALSTNETTVRIDASAFSSGVYILKVENSGDVKTKKVIK